MQKKTKLLCTAVACISFAALATVAVANNQGALGLLAINRGANQNTEYTLTLDESNSPTTETTWQSNVVKPLKRTGGGINLEFKYSSVKAKAGKHAVLANNSSVVRNETGEDRYIKDFRSVSALYSGGKLFLKYGLSEALHYQLIPNDGTEVTFDNTFQYNVFELYVEDGDVELESLSIDYDCDEPVAINPTVNQASGENLSIGDGAIVSGLSSLRDTYAYGEEQIFHVKAKGDGVIEHVKVNGRELPVDTRFDMYGGNGGQGTNTGYYSFSPSPDDKIEISTSVDNIDSITVNLKQINPSTGAIDDVEYDAGTYVCDGELFDKSNKWYVKVTAPNAEDIGLDSSYVPNQDYICYEKGTNPTLTFYYSQLATDSGSSTAPSGAGTKANPYKISSNANWKYIVENADSFISSTTSGKYFLMTKSLDFTNQDRQVFGTYNTGFAAGLNLNAFTPPLSLSPVPSNPRDGNEIFFQGNFDGNYCSVRNMNVGAGDIVIDQTVVVDKRAKGLFAMVDGGANVANLSTYGEINTNGTYARAGGIAGISGGTITNCNSYVNIIKTDNTTAAIGGIVGDLNGNFKVNSTITNCTNYGNVSAPTSAAVNYFLGGIVGVSNGNNKIKNVTNCTNFGSIVSGGRYAAGILSYNQYGGAARTTLSDCTNFGYVESQYGYTAGIFAYYHGGTINNAVNFGDILTRNNSDYPTAGILGECKNTTLIETYNYGSIRLLEGSGTQAKEGGLIGYSSDSTLTIQSSSNYGDISFEGTSFKQREEDKKVAYIGGFVGWIQGSNAKDRNIGVSTHPCINFGDISSTSQEIGGCYGYISNTTDLKVSVDHFLNVGNINGYIGGGIGGNNTASVILNITYSANAGKISGGSSKQLAINMDVDENNHEYGLLG